ncbi:MAG: hypothetical protein WBJ25_07525, partial [Bacillota bacterium]
MKRALGILLLLVLVLGVVSLPAFAESVELSLKYWHAGVGGGDLQVGDVEAYEAEYYYDEPSGGSGIGYWFS